MSEESEENYVTVEMKDTPVTRGFGRERVAYYKVYTKTNVPTFKSTTMSVSRRYSDFQWLRTEIERNHQIVTPALPRRALLKTLNPFKLDDGIFEKEFQNERKAGLEAFIKSVANNPLLHNEKCLQMFLQREEIDYGDHKPGRLLRIFADGWVQ